jgi:hypothetical protein
MLSYVVVARKPRCRIPPETLAILRRGDLDDLAFTPEEHLCWTNGAESVAFGGWQAAQDVLGIGSHWYTTERGLAAFSGRCWPKGGMWRPGETWARQLERHWQSHPVVDAGQPFEGVFTAVSIAESGDGVIITDPLAIAMLHWAETDDFVAVASSAALAARVTAPPGGEPERDRLGVAWLPYLGYLIGDRTGFTSTRVLPIGAHVAINPAWGAHVDFAGAAPWRALSQPRSSQRELVEAVHRDLKASIRSFAQLPADERIADITGGKDSRLILALLLQEGLTQAFTFRTIGLDHMPDADVGREIARRFGLQHNWIQPEPMDQAVFGRRLRAHVYQTSGMFNAWDLKGGVGIHRSVHVSGMCGELLSTHFKGYPSFSSATQLREEFLRRNAVDALALLQRDVRQHCLDVLTEELVVSDGAARQVPDDLLDAFYVRNRLRRWFGATEELGDSGRVFPLYSLAGLQAAFSLGPESRRTELLHFAIMRDAFPALSKVPFANRGWAPEVFKHLPDAEEYRVAPRTYAGPKPRLWQVSRLEQNRDVLEDHLLDDRSNPVFEILDRKAVARVLRRPLPADVRALVQLYGALTAAVWLGRHETPSRIGGPGRVAGIEAPTDRVSRAKRRPSDLVRRLRRRSGTGRR